MAGIFVNYRSFDEDYGAILIDRLLVARFGDDLVFRDSRSIPAGTDFPPLLWRRLRESQVLIVVIGPHWLARDEGGRRRIDSPEDYVRREIAEALRLDLPVVPVLLDGTVLPTSSDLPDDISGLAQRQYRHVRKRSAEHDMQRVIAEIEQWVQPKAPPGADRTSAGPAISPQIGTINGPAAFGPGATANSYGDVNPRRRGTP